MNSSNLPVLKKDTRHRQHVSVFLDLLGWGPRLEAFDSLYQAGADDAAAKAELIDILRRIEGFRRNVVHIWDGMHGELSANLGTLSPELLEMLRLARDHESVIQIFGDTIVISVPIRDGNRLGTWRAIQSAFGTAALLQMDLLLRSQIIRGGIDIGWGFVPYEPPHENEVIGACIVRAYEAEKSAVYPRVAVGAHALTFLQESHRNPRSLESGDQQLSAELLSCLKQDTDGVHFLDFLGPNYTSSLPAPFVRAVREAGAQVAEAGLKDENDGVRAKYQWLRTYLAATATAANGSAG